MLDMPAQEPITGSGSNAGGRWNLGTLARQQGLISQTELDYALQKQAVEGGLLGNLLVEHGFATQKEIAQLLARQRTEGGEFVDVDDLPEPSADAMAPFNQSLCLKNGFLPISVRDGLATVALGDGSPEHVRDLVQRRTGWDIRFVQSDFAGIKRAIRQHFYFAANPQETVLQREIRLLENDRDRVYSPEKLVDHLLNLAVRERATDIHIAPGVDSRHVLFRIDGVLRPMFALSPALDRVTSFIKLCAEMDVAEQRLPQDGSFSREVMDQPFTMRVSTLIAEHGERMVLRLLPERNALDKLTDLGFLAEDVEALGPLFSRPSGLILLTGPTGSGKSTTLHAALRMQALVERNVLTVEDPVEYRVNSVCQTEVNARSGYTFSNALRYFLRHDPDVILVGEIRDAETARAAIDAASTGHLVLSTLHVGSIFGVVPRLKILGMDTETIAENLLGVINQRLVRRICPHCKESVQPTDEERQWLGVDDQEPVRIWRGRGCDHCRGSGYHGRLPIYEQLVMDRIMADAVADDVTRGQLRDLAAQQGMRSIHALARRQVLAGETTVEEIHRAVGNAPQ